MSKAIDKRVLIEKLYNIAQQKELEMKRASKDAQERANEAEGAMKSRYDTFKEEGQYLAGGLKIRHEELKAVLAMIKEVLQAGELIEHTKIQLYSFVELEFDDGTDNKYFITPFLGGEKLDEDITIITPHSPVGKSLMGKEEGQEFNFSVAEKIRRGEIVAVI